jgi:hypothetical protein
LSLVRLTLVSRPTVLAAGEERWRDRRAMRPRAIVVSSKNASTASEAAEAWIRHCRSGYPLAQLIVH